MQKKFKKIIFGIIFFSGFLVWQKAEAATYYVKNGGNDNLAGTSDETAWATISKVQSAVASGDTVYFRSQDTWSASFGLAVLSAVAGVIYDGSTYGNGTKAKLQATGSADQVVQLDTTNVIFRGFEVDVNEQAATGIGIGRRGNASNVTVDDCIVHDTASSGWLYGITIGWSTTIVSNVIVQNTEVYHVAQELVTMYPSGGSVSGVTIRNCKIHDGGEAAEQHYGDGIILKNNVHDITIEYNTIYNCSMPGVSISQSNNTGYPYGITIRYNIIHDNYAGIRWNHSSTYNSAAYGNLLYNNGYHPDRSGGHDIEMYGTSSANIYNNTIYNTRSLSTGAVHARSTSGTVNFRNNAIYTINTYGIYDEGGYFTHSNNLVYRASGNAVYDNGSSYTSANITTWDTTALGTNPSFTGGTLPTGFTGTYGTDMVPNTNYFALGSASPAIDKGVTLSSQFNLSINSAGLSNPFTRPQGTAYDIGAYEYQSSFDIIPPSTPSGLSIN